ALYAFSWDNVKRSYAAILQFSPAVYVRQRDAPIRGPAWMLVVICVNQERIWYTAWWNYGILWEQLKFRVSLGPRESWPYGLLPQRKWSSGPGQIARHIGRCHIIGVWRISGVAVGVDAG